MNRKRNDGFYMFWSASIVLCLFLVLFVFVFVSCRGGLAPKAESPAETEPAESPEPTAETTEAIEPIHSELGETEDFGQEYIDKFVFIGDSTTYGLAYYEMVSPEQVWVPVNKTLTLGRQNVDGVEVLSLNEVLLIKDAAAKVKPEYILLTIGVNGVSVLGEEAFKREYKSLVEDIKAASPETKLILNTIYPVGMEYEYLDSINNTKINAANEWIQDVAEETGVRFLRSNTVLIDSEGWLPVSLTNDGGLHLNKAGFELVLQYIRTHGYE